VTRCGVVQLLDVPGDDDGGRRPPSQRGTERPVENVRQLFRNGDHLDVLTGYILEEAEQIDLLLVRAPSVLMRNSWSRRG
jgi:hypothetical protein